MMRPCLYFGDYKDKHKHKHGTDVDDVVGTQIHIYTYT